jgi:NAD(P)-dependent dehydrogenase (short-subunit alcohol dehydrogenase family)
VRIAVIGAPGDVGRGVVAAALTRRWPVVAVGRRSEALTTLVREHGGDCEAVVGDLGDATSASRLAAALAQRMVHSIVVAVNSPIPRRALTDWPEDELWRAVLDNLAPHHRAAVALLPVLPADGVLLGIGGGTADFVLAGLAPLSLAQAAQRMLYRAIAKEHRREQARTQEVLIASMVRGESNRASAPPEWLGDDEIGSFVCDLLAAAAEAPEEALEPVVTLKPRTVRS